MENILNNIPYEQILNCINEKTHFDGEPITYDSIKYFEDHWDFVIDYKCKDYYKRKRNIIYRICCLVILKIDNDYINLIKSIKSKLPKSEYHLKIYPIIIFQESLDNEFMISLFKNEGIDLILV